MEPGPRDSLCPSPVPVALAPWKLLVSEVLVVLAGAGGGWGMILGVGCESEPVLRADTEGKTRSSNEPMQDFAI